MYTLEQLATLLGAQLKGDKDIQIHSLAGLDQAGESDLTFLGSSKFRQHLKSCKAAAVIVRAADAEAVSGNALIVDNPYLCFAKALSLFYPTPIAKGGIHPSAVVDDSSDIAASAQIAANVTVAANCQIADGVYIGPGCVIEEGVVIGKNTRLDANVTICKNSRIGMNSIIHPGVVIGSDGFGFANDNGRWIKIAQIGRAIIGDDVEIGANTTIDCGAMGDTVIGNGVKLDNLIQVGHNVKIGEHTAIAAQTGIAGSTVIGSYCAIGGQVGIVGHLTIADKVTITATTWVTQSILEAGSYSSGTPMEPTRNWHRNYARFKKLDNMAKRLNEVEMRLNQETNKSKE